MHSVSQISYITSRFLDATIPLLHMSDVSSKANRENKCVQKRHRLSRPHFTGVSIIQTTTSHFYLRSKFETKLGENPSVTARSVPCVSIPMAFGENAGQQKGIRLTFPNQSTEVASANRGNASKPRDVGRSPGKSSFFFLTSQHTGIGLPRYTVGSSVRHSSTVEVPSGALSSLEIAAV